MSQMKVYTHYYKAEEIELRWRTLLQFGNSWDIIGSVVMKNPGSSEPRNRDANGDAIHISDKNILVELRKFDDSDYAWYEFNSDDTINCVRELFKKYYSSENLQGVIQIFNIFYVKDAVLKMAINKDKNSLFNNEDNILEEDIKNLKMPIYLGFGDLRNKSRYKETCLKFFETAKNLGVRYCAKNYYDNKFYHPQYLMKRGKNKPECQKVLQDFINSKCKD